AVFFARAAAETMKPNSYYDRLVSSVHKTVTGTGAPQMHVPKMHVAPRTHLAYMLRAYDETKNNGTDTPCVNGVFNQFHPTTNDFVTVLKTMRCVFSATSIVKEHPKNPN